MNWMDKTEELEENDSIEKIEEDDDVDGTTESASTIDRTHIVKDLGLQE